MQWKIISGPMTYEGRIPVPAGASLRDTVITLFHDYPESGHFGAHSTGELVSRAINWAVLDAAIRTFIAGWQVCHKINAPRHPLNAVNMPLLPPLHTWEGITIDFVTELARSTKSSFSGIAVIVDQTTKIVIYVRCQQDIDSPELACMLWEHMICKHGVPDNIITDCGTQFKSRFWTRVCCH